MLTAPADSGNGNSGGNNDFFQNAAQHAMQYAGSSGNSDLFANVAGAVGQKQDKLANEELDEQGAFHCHGAFCRPSILLLSVDLDDAC